MKKKRFFATLHFARKLTEPNKNLRELLLSTFRYGYTVAYEGKDEV